MKNNLSTLSILHYVYGGFACFVGAVVLFILLAMGQLFQSDWFAANTGEPIPPFVGLLFNTIGWVVFALLLTKGLANIISGNLLARARGRAFSQVVAAVDCLNIPFGITLGIFTFAELHKPEVKRLYAERGALV
jgi:hypothetical protein